MKPFNIAIIAVLLCACALAACGGGAGTASRALAPLPANAAPPGVTPSPIPSGPGLSLTGPLLAPNGGWGAPALARALSFPVQSGYNGAGYTIAIVTDAWLDRADLQQYLAFFEIPQTLRTITGTAVDGGPVSNADAQRSALDVETVAALAPGARIIVYETPDLGASSVTDAYQQIANDSASNVVLSPFGACEAQTNAYVTASPIVAAEIVQGVTFVAASGDQGSQCAEYPASDPNTIGVGGTETFPPIYKLTSNTVFNDFNAPYGAQEASGGGASQVFVTPPYQQGLSGTVSPIYRNVPDIAMPASHAAVYYGGRWQILSGTSWSASQFAAMLIETYQFCNIRFDYGAALPYRVYELRQYAAFIDVLFGNNGYDGFQGYDAQRGYDSASGIGVPIGTLFAQALCPINR